MSARIVRLFRTCQASLSLSLSPADTIVAAVATFSNDLWRQHNIQMRALMTDVELPSIHSEGQLEMGRVILKDTVCRILFARLSRFVRTRATKMHSTIFSFVPACVQGSWC